MQVVGYHLNRLDEPVFIAVSKPLLTEFGIHFRLESCAVQLKYTPIKVQQVLHIFKNVQGLIKELFQIMELCIVLELQTKRM